MPISGLVDRREPTIGSGDRRSRARPGVGPSGRGPAIAVVSARCPSNCRWSGAENIASDALLRRARSVLSPCSPRTPNSRRGSAAPQSALTFPPRCPALSPRSTRAARAGCQSSRSVVRADAACAKAGPKCFGSPCGQSVTRSGLAPSGDRTAGPAAGRPAPSSGGPGRPVCEVPAMPAMRAASPTGAGVPSRHSVAN